MLFWLCLIILIMGLGLLGIGSINWYEIKYNEKKKKGKKKEEQKENKLVNFFYQNDDVFLGIGSLITLIMGLTVLVMSIILLTNSIGIDAEIEESKEIYKAINYKVESGACRDELGLLNKEVIDEIQEWNKNVVYKQKIQDDFWVGVFYPNVYDQFETIEYEKYGRE